MACLRMVSKVPGRVLGCHGHPPFFLRALLPAARSPVPSITGQSRQVPWSHHQALFCTASLPPSDVCVQYRHGRPVLELLLPSRQEKCVFFLRPLGATVGDLLSEIHREDPGASATVTTMEGEKVSSASLVDTLLDRDFQLIINDTVHHVHPPPREGVSRGSVLDMRDTKHLVHLLHSALHLPDHQLLQERHLLETLDRLKQQLSPLEEMKDQIAGRAEFQASRALWGGVALLSVQGGALAWLTWWVYSWDVMEPVTYFITYATSIGIFSYFVLTKQDYVYPDARDRQYLRYFYKAARRQRFDVDHYNSLRDQLAVVEQDLRRLRNPTQLQLPVEQIQP